jgi:hypothetical protein
VRAPAEIKIFGGSRRYQAEITLGCIEAGRDRMRFRTAVANPETFREVKGIKAHVPSGY